MVGRWLTVFIAVVVSLLASTVWAAAGGKTDDSVKGVMAAAGGDSWFAPDSWQLLESQSPLVVRVWQVPAESRQWRIPADSGVVRVELLVKPAGTKDRADEAELMAALARGEAGSVPPGTTYITGRQIANGGETFTAVVEFRQTKSVSASSHVVYGLTATMIVRQEFVQFAMFARSSNGDERTAENLRDAHYAEFLQVVGNFEVGAVDFYYYFLSRSLMSGQ